MIRNKEVETYSLRLAVALDDVEKKDFETFLKVLNIYIEGLPQRFNDLSKALSDLAKGCKKVYEIFKGVKVSVEVVEVVEVPDKDIKNLQRKDKDEEWIKLHITIRNEVNSEDFKTFKNIFDKVIESLDLGDPFNKLGKIFEEIYN